MDDIIELHTHLSSERIKSGKEQDYWTLTSWPTISNVSKNKYVPLNIYFLSWLFTIIYYSSYIHGLIHDTSIKSVTVQQKTHLSLTCCTTSVWRRLRSSHLKISFSKYTRPSSLFLFFISVAIILFYQITTVSVFIDPFTVHWLTVTGFGTGTTIILIQILTNLISIICWSWEESTSGYYSQILCTNIRRPLLITVSITRRYWIHSVIFHSSFLLHQRDVLICTSATGWEW